MGHGGVGGGHPQARTTTSHLHFKDAQSARVNRAIRVRLHAGPKTVNPDVEPIGSRMPGIPPPPTPPSRCHESVPAGRRWLVRARRRAANGGCADLRTHLTECALLLGCITRSRADPVGLGPTWIWALLSGRGAPVRSPSHRRQASQESRTLLRSSNRNRIVPPPGGAGCRPRLLGLLLGTRGDRLSSPLLSFSGALLPRSSLSDGLTGSQSCQ